MNGVGKGQIIGDILVRHITEDNGNSPLRDGLKETPRRFSEALDEWFAGYKQDPHAIAKVFRDGAERVQDDEMVVLVGIPFYSHCEHHIAPIWGHVHIAYIPGRSIMGLSKFKRLVDVYARRLQVQERLTSQIADIIHETLDPKGIGVVVEARHMCMESRGTNTMGNSLTKTTALRGIFKTRAGVKEEFFSHIGR